MAWERHEAARVGEHADEAGEQPVVRKGVKLPLDGFFLVEEPPAAAELNFPWGDAVLEGTERGGEYIVVGGIEIVEDHFRQRVFAMEQVEIFVERFGLRPIADGVESGVGADFSQRAGVNTAKSAEMELLGPAAVGV